MEHELLPVCVIGGTGFLGTHLVQALAKRHSSKIKVLSRHQIPPASHISPIEFVKGDLLDLPSLFRFIEPQGVVVNVAYMGNRPHQENFKAVQNLALACRTAGVKKLIHLSTAAVVGRTKDEEITESTVCKPFTHYEKTRLSIEQEILSQLGDGPQVIILRPTEIFGEGGRGLVRLTEGLLKNQQILNNVKMTLFAKRRLHLVYVGNVAAAIQHVLSAKGPKGHESYIISDDEERSNNFQDVVESLSICFGQKTKPKVYWDMPGSLVSAILLLRGRSDVNPRRFYSCKKLVASGFQKPIGFRDGLRCFAKWYSAEAGIPFC